MVKVKDRGSPQFEKSPEGHPMTVRLSVFHSALNMVPESSVIVNFIDVVKEMHERYISQLYWSRVFP